MRKMPRELCQLTLTISLILVILFHESQAQCTFTHFMGLYQADCKGLGLTTKPSDLPEQIQVMDLSGNAIPSLPYDFFHGDLYLQAINLKENQIEDINYEAFIGCPDVDRIDLSDNRLKKISNNTFQGMKALRFLDLQGNQILTIEAGAFTRLNLLEQLNLQHNGLEYMSPQAFIDIGRSLKTLNLAYNKLTTLSQEMRLSMHSAFYQFHLYENPFNCDCNIRWIRDWMGSNTVSFVYGDNQQPQCQSPHVLRNRKFTDLHPEDFACAPRMMSNNAAKLIAAGSMISLSCTVTADPYPSFRWMRTGQLLDMMSSKRVNIIPSGSVGGNITSVLNISRASVNDSGTYRCLVSNTAGLVEVEYLVKVFVEKSAVEPQNVASSQEDDGSLEHGSIAAIAVSAVLFIVVISTFSCYIVKVKKSRAKRRKHKHQIDDDGDSEDKQKPDLIQHEQEAEVRTTLLPSSIAPSDFESELGEQQYMEHLYQSRQRGPVLGHSTSETPMYTSLQKIKTGNGYPGNCYQKQRDKQGVLAHTRNSDNKTKDGALKQKMALLHRQSSDSLTGSPRKPPRIYNVSEEAFETEDCRPIEMVEYGTAV